MASPQPVAALLTRLRADPGRPRVTWYSEDERVELSGHVLDNWVSKTTNLLVEELDVGPGSTVLVDLPCHWRAVVWWLAVLRSGACLTVASAPDDSPDVVVTTEPAAWPGAPELVVVTLPALARRAAVTLPAGAIDAAAAVMTYGDALGPVRDPRSADVVLRAGDVETRVSVTASGLLDWAARTADLASLAVGPQATAGPDDAAAAAGRRRALLTSGAPSDALLAACLVLLDADGSLVLCSPETTQTLRADPERLARLRSSERVTD